MGKEADRLVALGAWEDTTDDRFVSPMFLVPKKDGGWRLVVDLRHVNEHCRQLVCRYESLQNVRRLARPEDWMISWDVADGFYHLAVRPAERCFFTFRLGARLLSCACLPMGWSASPYYFTKLMRAIINYLRAPAISSRRLRRSRTNVTRVVPVKTGPMAERTVGLRVLPYVDDFLLFAKTEPEANLMRDFVGKTLMDLGVLRKEGKGEWDVPVQRLEHLGMVVDSARGVFQVTPKRVKKLRMAAKDLICRATRDRRLVPKKMLGSFAGLGQSVELAVPACRFYLRAAYDSMGTNPSWSGKVRLNAQALRDLQWWADFDTKKEHARAIWRSPDTATLHCDASLERGLKGGWGGVLNYTTPARGFFRPHQLQMHITHLELLAVRLTVETFLDDLRGRRVKLFEDNQAVMYIINKLSTKSPAIMTELRRLWLLLDTNDIRLRAEYIRSAENVFADALSREEDDEDWQLHPRLFEDYEDRWGPHTIDRFASANNTHCTRFNSRWLDPKTEAVDALARPWRVHPVTGALERSWLNPPWSELPDVIQKLREEGAAATVVAPCWASASWFPDLMEMSTEVDVLPPESDMFLLGKRGSHAPLDKPGWSVVVCRVEARAPARC